MLKSSSSHSGKRVRSLLKLQVQHFQQTVPTMILGTQQYKKPAGLHEIPSATLDLRPDDVINFDILNPKPIDGDKNIWLFWHQGFSGMHPYTQRNVRIWHRRFSKQGWIVRVLDRVAGSPLNVEEFLDVNDPKTFPQAFVDGKIGGDFAPQHTSDLVRWPLLLKYGGVYADVGVIQIGDLDALWNQTIGDPNSPSEVLSYSSDDHLGRGLTNYFLGAQRNNIFFSLCQQLFLELWAADGGRISTDGMWASPLLKELPLMGKGLTFEENGKSYSEDETQKLLTDYIIQGQVISMVMALIDEKRNWNGPKYVDEHIFTIDYMEGSQLINVFTDWNGRKAFDLMSLHLPKNDEKESADQKLAREVVEGCLQRSFGFKLAHGLILRVFKETLGSLWRANPESDIVPGTYAYWFRHGTLNWTQDEVPTKRVLPPKPPLKIGPLLGVTE